SEAALVDANIHRCELKTHFNRVSGRSAEVINQYPVVRLDENHPPPMRHRIGKLGVAIMAGIGEIERIGGEPSVQLCAWPVAPGKRSCRLGLPHCIDDD